MLVDIHHIPASARTDFVEAAYVGDNLEPRLAELLEPDLRYQRGVYETDLNFHCSIEKISVSYWEGERSSRGVGTTHLDPWGMGADYKWDECVMSYGVADNVDQVLKFFSIFVGDPTRQYVIYTTTIRKEDQEPMGGWRWHKWGEYIGDYQITTEYLYNEPEVEQVIVFRIQEVELPAGFPVDGGELNEPETIE